jgi:2-dehydropantoate 2-reductase
MNLSRRARNLVEFMIENRANYLLATLRRLMKHAILGAGAVGGLVGAVLAHEGEDVTLLIRPKNRSGHPEKLTLSTPNAAMESPVRIETKLTTDVDVLWIAVKAYQLIGALRAVPPESKIGTIIPLLNGIDHVDLLRVRFGHDRVVPATIAVEAVTGKQ